MKAILLFAHGSRNPAWAAHFEALRDEIAGAVAHMRVGLCYLELCAPDFEAGIAALAKEGATQVEVVPIFLAPGKHTLEDLPELVAHAQAQFPTLNIVTQQTLLEDTQMRAAIAQAVLKGAL